VWVAKIFSDRQDASRFQGLLALDNCRITIRYFPKRRYQKNKIETFVIDLRLRGIAKDGGQVADPRCFRAFHEPLDHSWLDVYADHFTTRKNTLCGWDQQTT